MIYSSFSCVSPVCRSKHDETDSNNAATVYKTGHNLHDYNAHFLCLCDGADVKACTKLGVTEAASEIKPTILLMIQHGV